VTCDQYTLSVSGIKDRAGNTIVSTNLSGTMPSYQLNYALDGTATDSSNPFGFAPGNANRRRHQLDYAHGQCGQ